MRLSPIRKKLTICLSSALLSGCGIFTPQVHSLVYCHQWTKPEKIEHYRDDLALPEDNSLHGIIKDYERVCDALT